MGLFPIASFDTIELGRANQLLVAWEHKMGPVRRPMGLALCHALFHGAEPVAITVTSDLVRETVGGAAWLTRENCIELSRVCAVRPGLCRVVLRMWRELVFPALDAPCAISYQDAVLHTGNLYRNDGWQRIAFSHSGTDARSGRKGRDKYIWLWPRREAA